jgi:DNA-directed RNA polymerase subunit H (RpoH/RPB5)
MDGKHAMDPTISDILIRSRRTILEILEDRGYDTIKYQNISPDQILTLAEGHPRALDIIVPKREGSTAPCDRAVVVYMIQERIKGRLGTFVRDIYEKSSNEVVITTISHKDDVIVIINEPAHDAFDKSSLQLWQTHKARMTFFHIKEVVVHLGRHVLVPPHRKLSDEEAKATTERLRITQRSQLPLIKRSDIQARILGLVPGDMVDVLRPSPTAGVIHYPRLCVA